MNISELSHEISNQTDLERIRILLYLEMMKKVSGCEFIQIGECPEELEDYKFADYGTTDAQEIKSELSNAWHKSMFDYFLIDNDSQFSNDFKNEMEYLAKQFCGFDLVAEQKIKDALKDLNVVVDFPEASKDEDVAITSFVLAFHEKHDFVSNRFAREAIQDVEPRIKKAISKLQKVTI
ncbi:MAG: hypothetical protein CMP22_02155 [Rickettsiales bacterium]|nr:hypothetical protein [Rickettsiales bacterium]|tara:strand:+ start:810 stop:1346 length:537 start_codon:yes stop_codon:yes gene_type:complete